VRTWAALQRQWGMYSDRGLVQGVGERPQAVGPGALQVPQCLRNGFHGPKVGGNQESHVLGTHRMAPGAQEEAPGAPGASWVPPAGLQRACGYCRGRPVVRRVGVEGVGGLGGGGGMKWAEPSKGATFERPLSFQERPHAVPQRAALGAAV